jgi:hypothetical protein
MAKGTPGLLGLIDAYDNEQQRRIAQLEEKLEAGRVMINNLTTLLMSVTEANERKTLELILAGRYDGLAPSNQEKAPAQ